MGKKGLGIVTGLIIVGIFVGWYYFSRESRYIGTSALRAVPVNSPLIIEARNIFAFTGDIQENPMWEDLSELPGFSDIQSEITYVDSLFSANREARELFRNKPLVMALGFEGNDSFNQLYLTQLDDISEKNIINQFIRNVLAPDNAQITHRKYDHVQVYEYVWNQKGKQHKLVYAFHKGIFIAGENPVKVEEAIRQLNTSSLLDKPHFQKVYKTAGVNVDMNFYINYQTFPRLLSLCTSEPVAHALRGFNNFATWSEIDMEMKQDEILLNGFTYSDDSVNNYQNIFLHQQPQKFRMEEVLPSETSFLLSFNLSNPSVFFKDYEKYLDRGGKYYAYENKLSAVKKSTGVNPQEMLKKLMDREIAMVYTRGNPSQPDENRFLVMRTHSKSQAEKSIREMVGHWARVHGKSLNDYVRTYHVDKQTAYPIYNMPVDNFGERVFGPIFRPVPTRYVSFVGNYMVMGDSYRSLSGFIKDYVLQEVLKNNTRYQEFSDRLSQRCNFYMWFSPGRALPFFKDIIHQEISQKLEPKLEHLLRLEAFGWEFGPENGMIYNSALLRYNPNLRERPQTVWSSHLETDIQFKPQFVINHYDRDNREVVVQDTDNNFYLINKEGRVLWKIKLPGPIMGDVYQIDYYKNGKLQYLFNTPGELHLIDRNGNYVENYPVKLRSKATNGVAVFDYDQNKNYRFFIACADHHVYLYDKRGKLIPGWTFGKTEHEVTQPVEHFRVGNRDYIVFFDKNRTYIEDRKGNNRVQSKAQYVHSMNNNFVLENGNGSHAARLVGTDEHGKVYFLYFNGDYETKEIENFSPSHYFMYDDMNADGKKDFVYLDGNDLTVYDSDGKKMFNHHFKEAPDRAPQIYTFSANNKKIGVVNPQENLIYLFNKDGSLYNGFPMSGNSRFSIGFFTSGSQHFNLVVGSADGFLYNYYVQ